MSFDECQSELEALDAIYGPDFERQGTCGCGIKVSSCTAAVRLEVVFAADYPNIVPDFNVVPLCNVVPQQADQLLTAVRAAALDCVGCPMVFTLVTQLAELLAELPYAGPAPAQYEELVAKLDERAHQRQANEATLALSPFPAPPRLTQSARRAYLTLLLGCHRNEAWLPLPVLRDVLLYMCRPPEVPLLQQCVGHSEWLYTMEVFQGRLWTGAFDSDIRVWDGQGRCVQRCVGHSAWVYCLAVVEDHLWSGSVSGAICIWAANGQCVRRLQGHTNAVNCIHHWGALVWTGSSDGTVGMWTLDGSLVHLCHGHTDGVFSLAWFGGAVWSASGDKTLRIWADDGELLMVCKEHKEAINCLMAAPNRAWSGAKDGTIRLYTKSGFNCTTVKASASGITCFLPLDGQVWVGTGEGTILLCDAEAQCLRQCVGHVGWIHRLWLHDDTEVWSGGGDGCIRVWSREGHCLRETEQDCQVPRALCSFAGHVWSGRTDGTLCQWKADGTSTPDPASSP